MPDAKRKEIEGKVDAEEEAIVVDRQLAAAERLAAATEEMARYQLRSASALEAVGSVGLDIRGVLTTGNEMSQRLCNAVEDAAALLGDNAGGGTVSSLVEKEKEDEGDNEEDNEDNNEGGNEDGDAAQGGA
ncbi:MAG: hypothetical protein OK436_01985 [Thaumarchaeota archaeon]|nr:hypothetical protein [Nitrososphaerota archaeon]